MFKVVKQPLYTPGVILFRLLAYHYPMGGDRCSAFATYQTLRSWIDWRLCLILLWLGGTVGAYIHIYMYSVYDLSVPMHSGDSSTALSRIT